MTRKTKSEDPQAFRVARSKVGFTWSCPIDRSDNPIPNVEAIVERIEAEDPAAQYIVAEEQHENGKRHYHAYVKYSFRLDISDVHHWDYFGVHPNIIKPGNGWIDYCAKKGNYRTNFYQPPLWERTKDMNVKDALALYEKEKPDHMSLNYSRVLDNLQKRKRIGNFSFAIPKFTSFPKAEPLVYPEGSYCLHVYGIARAGKTQFVKYCFPNSVLLTTPERLDDPCIPWESVEHIIFDDYIPVAAGLPDFTVIQLLDRDEERDLQLRYHNRPNRHHIKKIFVSNERDIFYKPDTSPELKNAIDQRLVRHHVAFKLF